MASRAPAAFNAPTVPRPHGQVVALAPRRYKLEITVDQQTHDKLRMLQDLLAHQLPSADPAIIVCRAIDRLLDHTLRKKAAVTDQARRRRGTRAMEYHHHRPYGKGGQHGAGNIALRCRAHNQYQADLDFGRHFMRDKRRSNGPHSARHV